MYPVSAPAEQFDAWLRTEFVRINTQLEEAYFSARTDVITGRPEIDSLKRDLLRQGGPLIERIAIEPLPDAPRAQYRLLGMIGHFLAACERHEAPLCEGEGARTAAWDLSTRLGQSLGVAPRFVFAHQSLFNEAIGGRFHTFTALPDEEIFIRFNALAVLAYRRAANALRDIADMGVSNVVSAYLFDDAKTALADVLRFNQELARQLDVDRFFFNIRPYFKTYRVGDVNHRGANAGDFAAINEIDVILGVCRVDDEFYGSIVREKSGHVPPEDQHFLRTLSSRDSLLDLFCRELDTIGATSAWRANAGRFLDVCKTHAAAYAIHHQRLVKGFLEKPAAAAPAAHAAGVTSSGPPLHDVVAMLQRLLDLRTARDHSQFATAASQIKRLQAELRFF
jgi:hypothetical protein